MKARIRGFTLVELSIVLVIIGILMGGILKGQELINSAKAKSEANDFKVIAAAYYGYLDRYHAVPGDDANADTHLGATVATSPTGTGNARGNGRIEGNWNSSTSSDESYLFWQHVRKAGLLTGSTAAGGPFNASSGQIGVTGVNPDSTASTSNTFGASFYVCSGNIDGRSARQIDNMLDDGVGDTGSVRVFPNTLTTTAAIQASPADTTPYVVCAAY